MVRTHRPYDRQPHERPHTETTYVLNLATGTLEAYCCPKCGAHLCHREAYAHALFHCPNRKDDPR